MGSEHGFFTKEELDRAHACNPLIRLRSIRTYVYTRDSLNPLHQGYSFEFGINMKMLAQRYSFMIRYTYLPQPASTMMRNAYMSAMQVRSEGWLRDRQETKLSKH